MGEFGLRLAGRICGRPGRSRSGRLASLFPADNVSAPGRTSSSSIPSWKTWPATRSAGCSTATSPVPKTSPGHHDR